MMLIEILRDICLPLLAVMGLGWGIDRKFRLSMETLVKLNLYVFVPAFIFTRLTTSELSHALSVQVIGFTFCVLVLMGVASWAVARNPQERIAMQLGTMFYNSGNWGIPLMALAFPRQGPVAQVFVLATMNVSMFTLGVMLAGMQADHREDRKAPPAWRRLLPVLRQPSLYAIGSAILVRWLDLPVQKVVFLWKPLEYLADALVGFALLTLGVQLSQTRPPRVGSRLAWALVIRLIGGPLIAIGLTRLFGFSGEFAAVLILGAASPTAVNAALVVHEFKGDSRFTAAVVFYTTLLAVPVVTALLAILRGGWIPWATP